MGNTVVGVEWKMDLQIERLNFIEKLYFNIRPPIVNSLFPVTRPHGKI